MEIANFSIGKGPPCEYFQQILEVSFDFSAIFRKKYKGPLFENTKRGVLGYFRWNCKIFGPLFEYFQQILDSKAYFGWMTVVYILVKIYFLLWKVEITF